MSTFSLKGGLYERAQKKYGLNEGKKLFTYQFFERHKLDAQVTHSDLLVAKLVVELCNIQQRLLRLSFA